MRAKNTQAISRSAAYVSISAAVATAGISRSDLGTVSARYATASRNVLSRVPSGNSIGSSKFALPAAFFHSGRALLNDLISVGGQIQKDGLGNMRALVRCNPFVVQVRTTIAFGVFDKGRVNRVGDEDFN